MTRLTERLNGFGLVAVVGALLAVAAILAVFRLRWWRPPTFLPEGGSLNRQRGGLPVNVATAALVVDAAPIDVAPPAAIGESIRGDRAVGAGMAVAIGLAIFTASIFMALVYPVVFPPTLSPPSVSLDASERKASLDAVVVLEFSGTLDKASVQRRLSVSPSVAWNDEDLEVAHSVSLPWLSATGWATTTVTVNPQRARLFMPETEYTLSLMDQSVTFRTITIPRVISVEPRQGAPDIDVWDAVRIEFNEPVEWHESLVSVVPPKEIVATMVEDGKAISIAPESTPWRNSALYTVRVDGEVSDRHGHTMERDFLTSFRTMPPIAVVSAKGIESNRSTVAPLEFAFDRAPAQEPTATSFRISPSVEGTSSWLDPNTLVWTPSRSLDYSTEYVVSIGGEATATNPVDRQEWTFRTSDPPLSVSIQGGSQSPATLRALPVGGLNTYTYSWNTGAVVDTISVAVPQGQASDVSVTVASGNQTASASVRVFGPPLPPPPAVAPAPGGGSKIVLTFDDFGAMGEILDILTRYDAKAIFFPTGNWARSVPHLIDRAVNEGHLVCNHTSTHADLTTLSADGIRAEVLGGAQPNCNLFRPPYGAYNTLVQSIVAQLGYQTYMWDIDTLDWLRTYPGDDHEIANIVLSQAFPGAVVLMHLQVRNTIAALPTIIEGLQESGYTVSW